MKVPSSVLPALQAAALVTQMALAAIVGALVGAGLDAWFGASPTLLLAFSGLGFLGGLLLVWRAFSRAQSSDDEPPGPPTASP